MITLLLDYKNIDIIYEFYMRTFITLKKLENMYLSPLTSIVSLVTVSRIVEK